MPNDTRELTDDELEALLAGAAAQHDVPAEGPARVLAAARTKVRPERGAHRGPGHATWLAWAAAVLVVLGLAAAAFTIVLGSDRRGSVARTADLARDAVAGDDAETAEPSAGKSAERQRDEGLASGAAGGAGGGSPQLTVPGQSPVPGAQPRVIKTGSLELEVRKGRFDVAVDRLTTLAAGAGGFVADSRSSEVGRSPSGTFTLRVPSARFEQVLTEARRLGTVKVSSSSGEDVTAQFTDLDARITSLAGTRDQLRALQAKAGTIGEILAVQDRLTGVQTELEQLQGQRQLLEDKASFGTLTVTVREPLPPGVDRPEPQARRGFAKAWHDAVDGFTGGIQRLIAGSGSFIVVLLCLAAVALVARAAWRVASRRFL